LTGLVNSINLPKGPRKRLDQQTKHSKGRDYFQTLPYEALRVRTVCSHSPIYLISNHPDQPLLCGLCFFREGWASEIPTRIHLFKTLADNGNPQTTPKFIAHLYLVMGLKPPDKDEPLHEYRRRRGSLYHKLPRAREQYTSPAWRLFPIASALWKLMGHQPPLGIVLVRGVSGRTEAEIAAELDTSLVNIHIRMAKAIRTAMGYLPRGNEERTGQGRTRGDDQSNPEPTGTH